MRTCLNNPCYRVALAVAAVAMFSGGDWLQFRGTDSNSATEHELPPSIGDTDNVRWKVELPGKGPASPVVVGNRVIVTGSSGVDQGRLHVQCFDASSGKKMWHRQFWATGSGLTHPLTANAAPTPACDGQRIFALFSSNDLICLDLDGNLQWLRGLTYDFPSARNDVGLASSPLAVGSVVVVQIENQAKSFAAGIDAKTGQTRWSLDRNRGANWASPMVLRGTDGNDQVILQSPNALTAHEPDTGKVLWKYEKDCAGICSAAPAAGVVYVPSGGVTALRPQAGSEPEVLWSSGALQPGSASLVAGPDKVYAINGGGVLASADIKTGKVLWRLRLEGTYWGTPVVARSRLYAINQDGTAVVVDVSGPRGKRIGKGSFGETILCSPAVAEGAMFVRSDRHLWKLGGPPKPIEPAANAGLGGSQLAEQH